MLKTILEGGGPVTWLILLLGFISLVLIVERLLQLRRSQIDVRDFLPGVINTLRSQSIKEAITVCDETPGPAAHIVRQAIVHRDEGTEGMYRATKEACLSELPRLERNMKAILTIVHVAPLLGLLGTVIGLMSLFNSMRAKETIFSIELMAPHLGAALISTAIGLMVSIPAYLFYNFFRQQIDDILIDMEKSASEIIYFLNDTQKNAPDSIGDNILPGEKPVKDFISERSI